MNPIRQTATSLIIDTSQFAVTIPGFWQEAEKPPGNNVVYCGHAQDGTIQKQFIVSGYLLTPGLGATQREEAFRSLLQVRRDSEVEVTGGEARVVDVPPRLSDKFMMGGYVAIHSNAGRVAFSRTFGDPEKAFNFYLEMWGFRAMPDVPKLMADFTDILKTVELK